MRIHNEARGAGHGGGQADVEKQATGVTRRRHPKARTPERQEQREQIGTAPGPEPRRTGATAMQQLPPGGWGRQDPLQPPLLQPFASASSLHTSRTSSDASLMSGISRLSLDLPPRGASTSLDSLPEGDNVNWLYKARRLMLANA